MAFVCVCVPWFLCSRLACFLVYDGKQLLHWEGADSRHTCKQEMAANVLSNILPTEDHWSQRTKAFHILAPGSHTDHTHTYLNMDLFNS